VIASDVEKCRSTLPQLCLNPFLLNQLEACVSEPEEEQEKKRERKKRNPKKHMHLNTGHHHLRAPKLGGSAHTLLRERPNSDKLRLQPRVLHGGSAQIRSMAGAPTLCSSDDVSMRDPHCKVMLSGRTSHTRVESISFFVPNWICQVGMVI